MENTFGGTQDRCVPAREFTKNKSTNDLPFATQTFLTVNAKLVDSHFFKTVVGACVTPVKIILQKEGLSVTFWYNSEFNIFFVDTLPMHFYKIIKLKPHSPNEFFKLVEIFDHVIFEVIDSFEEKLVFTSFELSSKLSAINIIPKDSSITINTYIDYYHMVCDLESMGLAIIKESTNNMATILKKFKLTNAKNEELNHFWEVDCLGTSLCEDITKMVVDEWKKNFANF